MDAIKRRLDKIESPTQIVLYPENHKGRTSEKKTVDWIPMNLDDWGILGIHILWARALPFRHKWNFRRDVPMTMIIHGSWSKDTSIIRWIKHSEGVGSALFLVIQAVPCILHCENRVSIKILTMLLIKGISNAQAGTFMKLQQHSNTATQQLQKSSMWTIHQVSRTNNEYKNIRWWADPVQREFLTADDGLMVGAITLYNNHAQKIVEQIDELCDMSGRNNSCIVCASMWQQQS